MNNKKTIFKTFGHIFLCLFTFIIIGFFIIPEFFLYFLTATHLCKKWGCLMYLTYSPFVLLISVIFYALSRLSEGTVKKNLLETRNNHNLIMGLFLGIGLIILGFISNSIKITILIGLFFLLSSLIQIIVNYFKNKNQHNVT